MSINSLLELCADSGIFLYTEDGMLKFEMTCEVFPEDLKNKVIEQKSSIIEFLSSQASQEIDVKAIKPLHLNEQGMHPAAYSQQRLWLIDRISGSSEQYNSPSVIKVNGQFDLSIAEHAITAIIQRHLPLRATFAESNEGVYQTFQNNFAFTINIVDLSDSDQSTQGNQLNTLLEKEILKPFNLAKDLLIRAVWFQLSNDEGILAFNIHHIAADAWSMPILNREFIQLYTELQNTGTLRKSKLDINYLDFVYWQQDQVANNRFDAQLQYWRAQLDSVPLEHSLKFDRKRPTQTTFRGDSVSFALDELQSQKFFRIAHENNVSNFMLVHALFSLFLSIKGESDDIVIGTPVANRFQQGIDNLIGFFTNTLVLRTDTSENIAFSEYLQSIKKVNLDAQTNQDLPFDQLVDELNPARSPNYSPLFQIMLTSNNNDDFQTELPDLAFAPVSINNKTAKFDLLLDFRESQNLVSFNLEFNCDLFDASTIARYAQQFSLLCQKVLNNTEGLLYNFDLLDEQSNSVLIEQMNSVKIKHDGLQLIHEYFEDCATNTPSGLAIQYLDSHFSYLEINQKANKLAYLLKSKGVGQGQIVGLLFDRRIDTIISILAVLKTGAAYTPLDVNLPKERIAYIVKDSCTSLVISLLQFVGSLELNTVDTVILDEARTEQALGLYPSINIDLTQPIKIDAPAVMIYTSGSTGKPKGVTESHLAITNLVLGQFQNTSLESLNKTMMFAPFSFDASVHEMVTTWVGGGALVLADQQLKDNLIELPNFIVKYDINRAFIPPSVFNLIVDIASERKMNLPSFKLAVVAGEELKLGRSASEFLHFRPDFELWNHYGPSETHVITEHRVNNLEHQEMPPIGKMIPNMNGYILDRHRRLVSYGEVGILHVSGPAVGPGYHMNQKITAEKYTSNPFKSDGYSTLYNTGDKVRYNEDGEIVFLGRADNQLKIRGFRIEPSEIEYQLQEVPSVSKAVIVDKVLTSGDKELLGFVQMNSADTPSFSDSECIAECLEHLRCVLPSYMIPNKLIVVQHWPLNNNGKIDKKVLRDKNNSSEEKEVLITETEHKLATLWSKLLSQPIDSFGGTSDFFDIGGNSLLAVRLLSAIQDSFAIETSVQIIFTYPKLKDLAAHLEVLTIQNLDSIHEEDVCEEGWL
ncbi:non-ribosomal peptide synthetase [Pseudoalteromonas aurantia]|uniref:Carrier domain-containing protein n=1 Tax=Pseudoalteromonas aurantia TaxID=43654 RepID=A0A5S3VDU7_9GAMM|nr:non-ribosomal peptide synthetase [Pseudoalteromonas aurantia]TMO69885.1 hypothetical protein CWC19_03350 [Pseudoalteromonas aurantia]TMO75136.1 hypothetical protein CWC20_08685 [Pseudoalteromonas aurantia]